MDNLCRLRGGACSVIGITYADDLVRALITARRSLVPNRERPELPGVKPATYRTKGLPLEHGNLESSVDLETVDQPPSPAASRPRGGAFVVVSARESRVHGKGRQSMSTTAQPLG